MLTITEQILFTIKTSSKILIGVNTLIKKPIEHKTCLSDCNGTRTHNHLVCK